MKLKLNVIKLRGTVFTDPIAYSPEFVAAISDVLEGYLPSFLSVVPANNIAPNNVVQNFWELVNPISGERIQFNNIKIDIIQNCDTVVSLDKITAFTEHCSSVFKLIASVTKQKMSRLAIAPSFSCIDTDENIKKFSQSIFIKNSFKGSQLDNCVYNNIFRVSEKINGKDITINYLVNVFATNRVEFVDGKNLIRETIAIDFDINTFANAGYVFELNDSESFFAQAPRMCEEFLNFYFE